MKIEQESSGMMNNPIDLNAEIYHHRSYNFRKDFKTTTMMIMVVLQLILDEFLLNLDIVYKNGLLLQTTHDDVLIDFNFKERE